MWLLDLCRPVSPRRKHFANIWKQAVSLMLLLKALNFLSLCLSVSVCVCLCVCASERFSHQGGMDNSALHWNVVAGLQCWWLSMKNMTSQPLLLSEFCLFSISFAIHGIPPLFLHYRRECFDIACSIVLPQHLVLCYWCCQVVIDNLSKLFCVYWKTFVSSPLPPLTSRNFCLVGFVQFAFLKCKQGFLFLRRWELLWRPSFSLH
jgi:hypothetical protein